MHERDTSKHEDTTFLLRVDVFNAPDRQTRPMPKVFSRCVSPWCHADKQGAALVGQRFSAGIHVERKNREPRRPR